MEIGDKARQIESGFTDEHTPPVGTIGKVVEIWDEKIVKVQWPFGSTTGDSQHYNVAKDLEIVKEQPCTKQ